MDPRSRGWDGGRGTAARLPPARLPPVADPAPRSSLPSHTCCA